ncbi:MAG: DUF3124 domain-containing protein [Flavobacteriales bacterium]
MTIIKYSTALIRVSIFLVLLIGVTACDPSRKPADNDANWNPPTDFALIDKDSTGSLKHLKVVPNLDSAAIRQWVYVAVNTDIFVNSKAVRLQMTNTLCIRNVSPDESMIVNAVEYYDAEGIKLRDYLEYPVELRPLQSIWLILNGGENTSGTGTNFIVDWASMNPLPHPIIESMMAGSYSQMGLSFKSETAVVKEWREGIEVDVSAGLQ